MNDSNPVVPQDSRAPAGDTAASAFQGLVAQQMNMTLMFLGKVPHPETGQAKRDLEAARFFIDQLEMLAVKTKGNLDKAEDQLLRQALTVVRMAFVEAVNESQPAAAQPAAGPAPPPPAAAGNDMPGAPAEESRKKFSKKYE